MSLINSKFVYIFVSSILGERRENTVEERFKSRDERVATRDFFIFFKKILQKIAEVQNKGEILEFISIFW